MNYTTKIGSHAYLHFLFWLFKVSMSFLLMSKSKWMFSKIWKGSMDFGSTPKIIEKEKNYRGIKFWFCIEHCEFYNNTEGFNFIPMPCWVAQRNKSWAEDFEYFDASSLITWSVNNGFDFPWTVVPKEE